MISVCDTTPLLSSRLKSRNLLSVSSSVIVRGAHAWSDLHLKGRMVSFILFMNGAFALERTKSGIPSPKISATLLQILEGAILLNRWVWLIVPIAATL